MLPSLPAPLPSWLSPPAAWLVEETRLDSAPLDAPPSWPTFWVAWPSAALNLSTYCDPVVPRMSDAPALLDSGPPVNHAEAASLELPYLERSLPNCCSNTVSWAAGLPRNCCGDMGLPK